MNVRGKKKLGYLYCNDWDLFKLILIVNAVLPLIMLLMCQMFQYLYSARDLVVTAIKYAI